MVLTCVCVWGGSVHPEEKSLASQIETEEGFMEKEVMDVCATKLFTFRFPCNKEFYFSCFIYLNGLKAHQAIQSLHLKSKKAPRTVYVSFVCCVTQNSNLVYLIFIVSSAQFMYKPSTNYRTNKV